MTKGTLDFLVDGKVRVGGFTDPLLKQGPIWFAVALNNDTSVLIL